MPTAAKGYNVFPGLSSDFQNVSVTFDCGDEWVVAVWAECFSKPLQLGVSKRLVGEIEHLITQP